jgi:hypothetical protein
MPQKIMVSQELKKKKPAAGIPENIARLLNLCHSGFSISTTTTMLNPRPLDCQAADQLAASVQPVMKQLSRASGWRWRF